MIYIFTSREDLCLGIVLLRWSNILKEFVGNEQTKSDHEMDMTEKINELKLWTPESVCMQILWKQILLLLQYCPGHRASPASDVSKMVKNVYVQVKNIKIL